MEFNYFGITARYTCDGLLSKVRDILQYLGARQNAQVSVSNCIGINRPTRTASVAVDFDSVAPAGAAESAGTTARWREFTIAYNRPYFMGAGECELIRAMQPLISTGFSLRRLKYETSCATRDVTLSDYSVSGEVLKPAK